MAHGRCLLEPTTNETAAAAFSQRRALPKGSPGALEAPRSGRRSELEP
jgi:hypothetical protein